MPDNREGKSHGISYRIIAHVQNNTTYVLIVSMLGRTALESWYTQFKQAHRKIVSTPHEPT